MYSAPCGFDMLHRDVVTSGKLTQRADLVDQIVDDLAAGAIDLTAAETLQVVVTGMSPDTDTMVGRQSHRFVHQIGIAGMKAGRNIGGADQCNEFFVTAYRRSASGRRPLPCRN